MSGLDAAGPAAVSGLDAAGARWRNLRLRALRWFPTGLGPVITLLGLDRGPTVVEQALQLLRLPGVGPVVPATVLRPRPGRWLAMDSSRG